MWLLIAFILVPLIEIALFIQVGGWLTLWPTLGIVIVTAFLGAWLVRRQGVLAVAELRGSIETLRDPLAPLAHGAMILFAGALLLTPGFLTDTMGFLLLVPAVRVLLLREVLRRVQVRQMAYGAQAQTGGSQGPGHGPGRPATPHRPDVIEAEFEDIGPPTGSSDDAPKPPRRDGPSGWQRH
jgi:UPF0716 protein FxsA